MNTKIKSTLDHNVELGEDDDHSELAAARKPDPDPDRCSQQSQETEPEEREAKRRTRPELDQRVEEKVLEGQKSQVLAADHS